MWNFPLFPEQASTFAPKVDALLGFLMAVAVFFSILIALLIVSFAVKYRHTSHADRRKPIDSHVGLEMVWTAIPLGIVLIAFIWGARVFYEMKTIPPNALEIYVVGKQWMWKIQHPEGQREINTLHVPVGQPIELTMISQDVIHNFSVPAFRMKQDVLPGRYTHQWFQATKIGDYHLFCDQYCGTLHAGMIGHVIVMDPHDFENWLEHWAATPGPMTATGAGLFQKMACATCHMDPQRAPSLVHLYGEKVKLNDGRTVLADEGYLRESIIKPAAKVVAGYQTTMPSFQNQLDEQSINELILYIKSLNERAP